MNLPNVVIVGRPNVGKSSLFNRLIQKQLSITGEMEGITIDRIYHKCEFMGNHFNLIDTGGVLKKYTLPLQKEINSQVDIALNEAELILFVVDGRISPTKEDYYLAKKIKSNFSKKVICVVNKIDNKELEVNSYEYLKLGFNDVVPLSTIHGININLLLENIVKNIDKRTDDENKLLRIGIIGKPNVGKSTLLNTLFKDERVIVSEMPGTTRDSIDTLIEWNGKKYIFTDTAGIKKNKSSLSDVEWYAELRSNIVIINSDIVLLILDATSNVNFIDEKIIGSVKEKYKPIILLVNKLDLIDNKRKEEIKNQIIEKIKFASWAPVHFISAKKSLNLDEIFDYVEKIEKSKTISIKKSVLNQFLIDLQMIKSVPRYNGIEIKLRYITYAYNGYPHFIIFANHPEKIHFSYKRFIENQIRKYFDFEAIPIKITFRGNNEK